MFSVALEVFVPSTYLVVSNNSPPSVEKRLVESILGNVIDNLDIGVESKSSDDTEEQHKENFDSLPLYDDVQYGEVENENDLQLEDEPILESQSLPDCNISIPLSSPLRDDDVGDDEATLKSQSSTSEDLSIPLSFPQRDDDVGDDEQMLEPQSLPNGELSIPLSSPQRDNDVGDDDQQFLNDYYDVIEDRTSKNSDHDLRSSFSDKNTYDANSTVDNDNYSTEEGELLETTRYVEGTNTSKATENIPNEVLVPLEVFVP
jgi:hypothetical protein